MKIREKTYQLLCQIVIDKQYSNLVLKNGLQGYSQQDKNLACRIVYGTIQNYRWLSYQYEDLVDKKLNQKTKVLLNMAVYQLLKMDKMPAFAVIDECVEISKKVIGKQNSKFVNAILRKVVNRQERLVEGDEDEKLAIQTSCPLWLVKMWNKQYPNDYQKLCLDTLNVADNYARINTLKTNKDQFKDQDDFELVDDTCVRCHLSDISTNTFFQNGLLTIQDYASQQIAKLLDPQVGERVLDMCSAPGSKTTHLAALMQNQGSITALELHQHRCELIKEQCQRLGVSNTVVKCCDATTYTDEPFDKILLDAPCSGYGVLKRKSDIKLHMESSDMDGIIAIQKQLLSQADKLLKPNGVLVYSTCTLNKKENELQVQNFLQQHPNYELIEDKTFMPFKENCDGFYMAKLIKQ